MLTRMSIKECQMLEQIVGNEEIVAESEVKLTKLECLELHCLPSLLGFSLWNCAFTFPSLKDVVVRECPKMKIFSQGVVIVPKLRRVRQTEGKEKRCWDGSLNATIQKLYMDQAMLQSSQPSSPRRSNLDVEAGQLRRNGKSHMSDGPSSEAFCEIKNPSVTKDLSPDTIIKDHEENPIQDQSFSTPMDISSNSQAQIDGLSTDQNKTIPPSSTDQSVTKDLSPDAITKHNETEEEPIQDLSLSTPMDIPRISQAQMDCFSTDQDKTIPPASPEQSVHVCEKSASDFCEDHFSKHVFKGLLPEQKISQIPFSKHVCERPASDFCEDQFSKPVFKGLLPEHNLTQIPSTYQHSRAIAEHDQDDPILNPNPSIGMEFGNYFVSQEQVLSDAVPTPYAAPEPATVSTSESKNRTRSSLELTSTLSSKASSKPPNITQSSFQLALNLITPAESCNSILESEGYSMSMQVMKNVLSKPLTEVASSTDRVLLLSTLKNLIKCQSHLLNAQQIEAIQVFIQNFGSIVAYHPFHENQIEQVGAFKLSVEDKKKGISMLKNRYEDLAQKSTSLVADKEALIKRLEEIEEEEDKIREDMKDVHAKIVTDSGTLEEAYTILLPELDSEQKEAEAKVCASNSQWAKMRTYLLKLL